VFLERYVCSLATLVRRYAPYFKVIVGEEVPMSRKRKGARSHFYFQQ
jgi:hypothetical protein